LVDADLGESGIRGCTQLGRRAVVEGPRRGDDGIAPGFIASLEPFPAVGVQPSAMDQHDDFGHWSLPSALLDRAPRRAHVRGVVRGSDRPVVQAYAASRLA